ncbi:adenosine kinase [Alkalicaulis satelles]|uniref:Adenosine kinase n=1 Tax=Alkalicaulis satelles TaxID=2609175 RepID=A0A5M6ZJ86_9PROT|nr:adenosine kinase [Alkalicaulis satelles]KAA5802291.1 adenosine kinase [Alkalicaulis satelles]
MSATRFDVLGVGNAIVDVLARVDEAFVQTHGLVKDAMLLIDEERADALYAAFPPGEEISGGSAANTLAGVASFGARGAYIGKVADDQLGGTFARDLRAAGVHFDTAPLSGGPSTARCLIAVPPDARRAMNTYLGASTLLDPEDIHRELVSSATIVFLEGYLFDREEAKAAYVRASEFAHAADRAVALTLSDVFCVERHRASFRQLVAHHVDVLFANEAELKSLYETDSFDEALAAVRAETRIAAVTRSEKGAVVVSGADEAHVPAVKIERLVDTTGAGDQFAAGFLTGFALGRDLETCGRLGVIAAGEVITHIGARPHASLKDLAVRAGLSLER